MHAEHLVTHVKLCKQVFSMFEYHPLYWKLAVDLTADVYTYTVVYTVKIQNRFHCLSTFIINSAVNVLNLHKREIQKGNN